MIKFYKNPNRMQASSAEVVNERAVTLMQKSEMQGHRLGMIIIRIKGMAVVMVAVEFFPVDEDHVVAGI